MLDFKPRELALNPELFSRYFLKILGKKGSLLPFAWNAAQKDFHSNRTGKDLVLKARQLGFSTYIQGETFHREITRATRALTLTHDDKTTQIFRETTDRFYRHLPEIIDIGGSMLHKPLRKYANNAVSTFPEFDSSHYIGSAGNVEVGRGGSYTCFHGSEVAFWKDAERIVAGAMQGGSPDVVLESTPNGAQGYFYERCMEALRGEGVWKLHFYPWWWDDAYRIPLDDGEQLELSDDEEILLQSHNLTGEQIKWRRSKIAELRGLFKQEYPEDPITCFLTSGNSYFGDLSGVFTAPLAPAYNPDHVYVAGLDFGQTNDYTAMPVLDVTAKQQVDLLHIRKLPWKEQRRRIVEMYRKWRCKRVGAERNSIGSVNIEALQDDKLVVLPFDTTNESKSEIMSELYEAIHTEGWRLQDHAVQRHEMQTYVATQTPSGMWRLAADGEGHDDTVMGLGLAKWAASMAISLPKAQPAQKSKWTDGDTTGWTKKY